MPVPFLVRPPLLEIEPPTVRLPPLTVTVRVAFMATLPVPRFRSPAPVKAKSPFQLCALLVESVMADPLVLLSVPPLIVSVPLPSVEALLIFSVPELSVVPPE